MGYAQCTPEYTMLTKAEAVSMWLQSKVDGKCSGVISNNTDATMDIFQRAKHMTAFHLPAKKRKEIEAPGKVLKVENQCSSQADQTSL